VGPRAGLDAVVKRNIPPPAGIEPPIIQLVVQCYTTELSWLIIIIIIIITTTTTTTTTIIISLRTHSNT
jgi:hypothetical protein